MIDYFTIGLTHALMLIAAWRLVGRADLDPPAPRRTRPGKSDGADDVEREAAQRDA